MIAAMIRIIPHITKTARVNKAPAFSSVEVC